MKAPGTLYLSAFVASALATALTLPLWRRCCWRFGLVDEPGQRKIHARPIPLAGGLALLGGLLTPLLFAVAWRGAALPFSGFLDDVIGASQPKGWLLAAILLGALGMAGLGWFDDKYELRPAVKFVGQCLVALLVAAAGLRVTLFVPSTVFSYVVTVFWILAVVNAHNLIDNMNGLCAGLGLLSSLWLGGLAAAREQYLVAALAFYVAGALAGFLPYNFPRASAFLGDAGSHLVGYLLAILAILPSFYSERHPQPLAVLSPLLVLAVPLGDMVRVVLLRWSLGRPFYVGDTNHLSHRFVQQGLSEPTAVILIWLMATAISAVTLWLI